MPATTPQCVVGRLLSTWADQVNFHGEHVCSRANSWAIAMRMTDIGITIVAMAALLASCRNQQQAAVEPTSTVSSNRSTEQTAGPEALNSSTDGWVGRWPGVEGTYLDLSRNGDKYVVEIANLDGPKTYQGISAGDHIEFRRGGKAESIRATDGKGTGMKWLLDQTNCLVVTVGSEGFCRN